MHFARKDFGDTNGGEIGDAVHVKMPQNVHIPW